jgi:hypothetical protein
METLRVVLPRVPHMVAHSMKSIDPELIAHALRSVRMEHNSEEIRLAMEHLRKEMANMEPLRVELRRIDPRALEAGIRAAMPDEATIRHQVRVAVRANRHGMEQAPAHGAERHGWRRRPPLPRRRSASDHRPRARAGRTVTHKTLLEPPRAWRKARAGCAKGARLAPRRPRCRAPRLSGSSPPLRDYRAASDGGGTYMRACARELMRAPAEQSLRRRVHADRGSAQTSCNLSGRM